MEKLWKAALGVAGVAAVAFLVFYSLYKEWLSLGIFPQLTQQQAFILMLVFLALTFLALLSGVAAWLIKGRNSDSEEAALHRLERAWSGVSYINCDQLIGPDVDRAGNALLTTALYWTKGYISKPTILEKYGATYRELFDQIDNCKKIVPGYTKPEKTCADFLPTIVRETYRQMTAMIARDQ